MTLILTHISRFGIVHASDSNLTTNGKHDGEGDKVFLIPRLNAGLSVAGTYSVGDWQMDHWMGDFINQQLQRGETQLSAFAESLRGALQKQMRPSEKHLIHLAGYVVDAGQCHPEFWFISNVHGIDNRMGRYCDVDKSFSSSEDFWSRDCASPEKRAQFVSGAYCQEYFNGPPEGRLAINTLGSTLNKYMDWVWSAGLGFRPPQSLNETEGLVKLQMDMVTLFFRMSSFSGPPIGGKTQIYSIPPPSVEADQSTPPETEARKCP